MATEVRLFGSVRVTVDGHRLTSKDFGGRKPKQLLEILVLNGGRFVPKDQLAHLLWGDALPQSAAGSLEHYVSLLRRRLSPDRTRKGSVIVTDHGGYRFDPARGWVDLTEFNRLFDTAMASSDRTAMEQALALVNGELLEDEPYADWALSARRDNQQRRLQLHVAAGELALAAGDTDGAVVHAKVAVGIDNLHEGAVRLLMTASYRGGEQAEALRVFGQFRLALAEDVGVDPMPETKAVYQAVLHQAAAPSTAAERRPTAPSQRSPGRSTTLPLPTQSARTTTRGRAGRLPLLGRDDDLQACLAVHRLSTQEPGVRSVLVDGEMGIGKSALLQEVAHRLAPARVVRVTCTEQTRSVAGALLEKLLGAHVGPHSEAVHTLIDDLTSAGARWSPVPLVAVRELDRVLALPGAFVLLVDDAHLADERSLEVLAALGTRRTASTGTVVLAADFTRLPHQHPLRAYRADLHLVLSPLTPEHLLSLGVPHLHERTGGVPLLVAGYLEAADADPGVPRSVARGGPAQLTSRVLTALRSADELTWRIVVACSVSTGGFGAEEVARLLGIGALEVAEVQERLCQQHVLVAVEQNYRFRYPLVREIVRDAVSNGRLTVLQRQLRTVGALDRRWRPEPPPEGRERRAARERRGWSDARAKAAPGSVAV